jgi:protein-tyrosine phosphatase
MAIEEHGDAEESQWVWQYVAAQWRRAFGLNMSRIEPLLFVGGQFQSHQWPAIRDLGVRAVLSLQQEREDVFEGTPPDRAMRLEVPDFEAPTLPQFREAAAFIAECVAAGLPVFIHCHGGIGRAPLAAAAYLVAERGLSAPEAIAHIRLRRPIVGPNTLQLTRLAEWAALVRAERGGS